MRLEAASAAERRSPSAVLAAAGEARRCAVTASRGPRPRAAAPAAGCGRLRRAAGRPAVPVGRHLGPGGFDCSGLVMQAYAAAGITIPRTSEEQWAAWPAGRPPAKPGRRPGVLRRFGRHARRAPGHVGLVVTGPPPDDRGLHASGFERQVRESTYGSADSSAAGPDTDPVGFTDPAAGQERPPDAAHAATSRQGPPCRCAAVRRRKQVRCHPFRACRDERDGRDERRQRPYRPAAPCPAAAWRPWGSASGSPGAAFIAAEIADGGIVHGRSTPPAANPNGTTDRGYGKSTEPRKPVDLRPRRQRSRRRPEISSDGTDWGPWVT